MLRRKVIIDFCSFSELGYGGGKQKNEFKHLLFEAFKALWAVIEVYF